MYPQQWVQQYRYCKESSLIPEWLSHNCWDLKKHFAQYTLKKRMAEDSDAVYNPAPANFLKRILYYKKEYQEVQELARQEQGASSPLCLGIGVTILIN